MPLPPEVKASLPERIALCDFVCDTEPVFLEQTSREVLPELYGGEPNRIELSDDTLHKLDFVVGRALRHGHISDEALLAWLGLGGCLPRTLRRIPPAQAETLF